MRRMMLLLATSMLLGCGVKTEVSPPQTVQTPAAPVVQPPPVVAPPPVVTPPPMTERSVAETGVGEKGRGYGGGVITEPIRQHFRVPQMAVFNIQIPSAMNLYKAQHDNKGPATHDEFMKEIVEANQLKLPKLPPGEKYVYDPATEELMVERPVTE